VDDRALLRDLTNAIRSTEGQGAAAQAAAIEHVLNQHGANLTDVQRLLGWARTRRQRELTGLTQRLGGVIEQREIDAATADAVDRFLRDRNIPG